MFIAVFDNDQPPTEIYTYGHLLSLHDGLPVSCRRSSCTTPPATPCCATTASRSANSITWARSERNARSRQHVDGQPLAGLDQAVIVRPQGIAAMVLGRSEEHTSELQSLMRISYAVFCLKKKKKK